MAESFRAVVLIVVDRVVVDASNMEPRALPFAAPDGPLDHVLVVRLEPLHASPVQGEDKHEYGEGDKKSEEETIAVLPGECSIQQTGHEGRRPGERRDGDEKVRPV